MNDTKDKEQEREKVKVDQTAGETGGEGARSSESLYGARKPQSKETYSGTSPLEIEVNHGVEKAMKVLKRKLIKEGLFKELKSRRYYEKPSERRKRKLKESRKKQRKEAARRQKNQFAF